MTANAGTPRARALSAALREARESSGVGLRELARQLEMSPTQISHWETGKRVPGIESVAMIVAALRVSHGERERLLDLARHASEPNWLTVGVSGVPQQLAGAIECERAASAITQWSPMAVPGLLQTPDYIRAVVREIELPKRESDIRVMVRAGRGEVLTRRDPLQFKVLVGEVALTEMVGSREIMAEQLDHLVEMSGRSNIEIRVVPLGLGWHPGLYGPVILYRFPETSPVLYFEHYSSGAFVPAEHDVREYEHALARIRDLALDQDQSLDCIEHIRGKRRAGR